jgi:putative MATE family efflux protein
MKGQTMGVKTLLGNPRKAIIKLSIPMIIAMSVQTIYNLADAIWVSGLGKHALAAVGFVFPFFFLIMALSTGIGVGGGAAISRRIGARDKEGADNVADHMIILVVIVAILFSVPLFIFLPQIFNLFQAGPDVTPLAVRYGRIIVAFSFVIFFSNVSNAILRAEGDTKRAMYAMVAGSFLNIILDPIFIYDELKVGKILAGIGMPVSKGLSIPLLGLGISGAAWATMIAFSISGLLLFSWLFLRKDTFVTFRLKDFKPSLVIIKDIMRVGLPASLMQMSMSINMMVLNYVVVMVGGPDGAAVFSTGWRIVSMATLPLMGIATAVVSVAGAAYGARKYHKLKAALDHAIRFGLMLEIPVSIVVFALADFIVLAFTWSESSRDIRQDLVIFLRIFVLMNFMIGFGMLSSSTFQAIGKGFNSLAVTLLRTVVFALSFSILFGIVLDWGLVGVWSGIILGNGMGALIAYVWVRIHIRKLMQDSQQG